MGNKIVEVKEVCCAVCGNVFDVYKEGFVEDGFYFCTEEHYEQYLDFKAEHLC